MWLVHDPTKSRINLGELVLFKFFADRIREVSLFSSCMEREFHVHHDCKYTHTFPLNTFLSFAFMMISLSRFRTAAIDTVRCG